MTSRERVNAAINHRDPDRVPVDIGASDVTCIHATALAHLRRAIGLKQRMVKVFEPMMMLGLVEDDLIEELGGDVVGLHSPTTLLGYWNENWKRWTLPDGTEVLIGGGFRVSNGSDGTIYAYPGGNLEVPPSAKMPSNGWYFDPISRQQDLSGHDYNARKDYADQYPILDDRVCRYFEVKSKYFYEETDYALFGDFAPGGFGDIFVIPGTWLEKTGGVRDVEDWILTHYDHPQYIKDLFEMQTESALMNLELYHQSVGERLSAICMSGTDFGTQNGPLYSPDFYREFYKPYHKRLNDWVHSNTEWKVFFHSCGSIVDFMDDFIEIGVDIINPVQFTAAGMDLKALKDTYGERIVFWGGGIDTQKTLPFGSPDEVAAETKNNVRILSPGGGFVCSAVHNIQGPTPVENILAFFQAIND